MAVKSPEILMPARVPKDIVTARLVTLESTQIRLWYLALPDGGVDSMLAGNLHSNQAAECGKGKFTPPPSL